MASEALPAPKAAAGGRLSPAFAAGATVVVAAALAAPLVVSRSVLQDLRIMVQTPLVMFFKRSGQ